MGKQVWYLFMVLVVGACSVSWGQGKATAPNPADGATDVLAPLLRWTAGAGAVLHNVYLGTTPDLGPAQLVMPKYPSTVYWHGAGIVPGTTYYWRIDEVQKDMTTVVTGDVWSFIAQPFTAFKPDPADGSNATPIAPDLQWLAGQAAQKHHVYFGADKAAVAAGTGGTDKGIVADPNYRPGTLEPLSTYFWRVDEIAPGDKVVAGAVWTFTTVLPVDDFESYTEAEGSRIYQAWIDGYGDQSSGSTVGYIDAKNGTFGETVIIHGGLQSMPLDYNNVKAPFFSEATYSFSGSQDWTADGADTLVVHVRGKAVDIEVPQVSTPPVIDGQVDAAWAQASIQYIRNWIADTEPTGPADLSGRFRVLYDTTNLYLFVDVNDEALVQDSDPAQGWLDDRIEVFIDGGNEKTAAHDMVNDYQYCFRWNNGKVEVPVEWYRSPDSLTGVQYAVATTATGYLFEIKLPWSTMIGEPAKPGKLFGIEVVINDDDDGGNRDSQIAWQMPTGDPHRTNLWGTAQLAEPGKPADLVYIALQDATNRKGIVVHPDPGIAKSKAWDSWAIPLGDFTGVNLKAIRKIVVGVGDRNNPVAGGAGTIYVDDIYLTRPAPVQ